MLSLLPQFILHLNCVFSPFPHSGSSGTGYLHNLKANWMTSSKYMHRHLHAGRHFLFYFLDGNLHIQYLILPFLFFSAARGLINHILFESEKMSGRKLSRS